MKKERRDELIRVLEMVSEDVEKDAKEFDGQPFNGKTMATYMGNHGAAINAIAKSLKVILEELTP